MPAAAESALAVLLGAAASARRGALDAIGVRAVVAALRPLAAERRTVEVRPGGLSAGGVAVTDPDAPRGLGARLAAWDVSRFVLGPELDEATVAALLEWASRPADEPLPSLAPALIWERAPGRGTDPTERLVAELARDPDSGLDLIELVDGERREGAEGPRVEARVRALTEKIRKRLGMAQLAAAESKLRKSLAPEALEGEAAARLGSLRAVMESPESPRIPELPLDALIALPEEDG